mmetsp:Transcript_971/g.1744  ORF Transcript_971/g.1744 Transcript_971/m.1744 type:complete len:82 (+) Transcript_971:476-721(+)
MDYRMRLVCTVIDRVARLLILRDFYDDDEGRSSTMMEIDRRAINVRHLMTSPSPQQLTSTPLASTRTGKGIKDKDEKPLYQ